jgi:hypothetical protein
MLYGRTAECAALDRLLVEAQAGRSQVLVLRGEPGIGKTALLDYVAARAAGCRVVRAAGVESEMELTFSGLHQLCGPLIDGLDHLPEPQATALAIAFGLATGDPPDRFLVGVAVLGLLSEVAAATPVVCIVDDTQWLDQASAQMVGFVARRLVADRVALVCAAEAGIGDEVLAGCPELAVDGLADPAARALLGASVHCWTSPSPSRSSRRATEIRSRSSSCPGRGRRPRSRAASASSRAPRSPAGSSRATCSASRRSRSRRACSCSSRLRSRSAIQACSAGRRRSSAWT